MTDEHSELKRSTEDLPWTIGFVNLPPYEGQTGTVMWEFETLVLAAIGKDGQWIVSAELNKKTREPKVWTHPDYRRQGYAKKIAVDIQKEHGPVNVYNGTYTEDGYKYVKQLMKEGVVND